MAAIFYNADEVFEMALQIERNGENFYAKASDIVTDPKAREMLVKLRDMERNHQKIFSHLRQKLRDPAIEPLVFDPDGQLGLYLRAAADTHVFNINQNPQDMINDNSSAREIMNVAIQFEKDSIVYFLGMEDMVPEKLGKENVTRLINEEKQHILFIRETMGPLVQQ